MSPATEHGARSRGRGGQTTAPVDRRPALLVRDPGDPSGATAYFVLLQWAGDRLTNIRDFRNARYATEGAEVVIPA